MENINKDTYIIIIKKQDEIPQCDLNKKSSDYSYWDKDSIKEKVLTSSPLFLNDVLLKHPFEEGKYVKIEEAEMLIIKSKLNIIKELCSSLGATSIKSSVHILETKSINENISANGGSSFFQIGAKIDVKKLNSQKSKYEQEIIDETEFIKPTTFSLEETYPGAKEIVEKYKLNNDPDIKSLLTLMNPQRKGSILKRQIVKFNASSEVNNLFELSASLDVKELGLSVNFTKTIEQINTLQITLDVTF